MGFGYFVIGFFVDKEMMVVVVCDLWQVGYVYYLCGFVQLVQQFVDYGGGWVVDVDVYFVENQCWGFYFMCGDYLNCQCNV